MFGIAFVLTWLINDGRPVERTRANEWKEVVLVVQRGGDRRGGFALAAARSRLDDDEPRFGHCREMRYRLGLSMCRSVLWEVDGTITTQGELVVASVLDWLSGQRLLALTSRCRGRPRTPSRKTHERLNA